jgi:hypothetical protein
MKEYKYMIEGKGNFYKTPFKTGDIEKNKMDSIEYDSKIDQYCINGQWEIPYHKELYNYKYELRHILLNLVSLKEKYEINIKNENMVKKLNNIINDIKKITIEI